MLFCARTRINEEIEKKIISLASMDLDWEYLINMASRHRLRPLLYVNLNSICPEKVPKDILRNLKSYYLTNVQKNLMLTGELVKVMKLLEENGIDAVTYKGPVLAHSVYGNIGFREFGDIDIFINRSDALRAKEIMILNGYDLQSPIKVKDSSYIKLESEYVFINKNLGSKVEINWNFEGMFFTFNSNPSFLFKDFKDLNINGFKFQTFSSVNQLIMLFIHIAKHDWARLSWLCDISEFIINENIDWNETLEKAQKLGVQKILLINLFLTTNILGLKLPITLLDNFDNSTIKISQKIKKRILLDDKDSWNLLEKLYLDLMKREKLFNGINDCITGAMRPSYRDMEYIYLPEKLFVIYYLIRPFLLIIRYGKKPMS